MVASDALIADVVFAEALPLRDLALTAVMVVKARSSQDDPHGPGHFDVTPSGRPASLAVEKGPHRTGPAHCISPSKNTPDQPRPGLTSLQPSAVMPRTLRTGGRAWVADSVRAN